MIRELAASRVAHAPSSATVGLVLCTLSGYATASPLLNAPAYRQSELAAPLIHIVGPVTSVARDATFEVLAQKVDGSRFDREAIREITLGDRLDVTGSLDRTGVVHALQFKKLESSHIDGSSPVALTGVVTSADNTRARAKIGNLNLDFSQALYAGAETLAAGEVVVVEGVFYSNRSEVTANTLSTLGPDAHKASAGSMGSAFSTSSGSMGSGLTTNGSMGSGLVSHKASPGSMGSGLTSASGSMGSGLTTSGSMGSGLVIHKTSPGSMGSGLTSSSGSMGSGLTTSGSMGSGLVIHKTSPGSMGSGLTSSSGSMGSGLTTSGSMGSGLVIHKTSPGSMGSGFTSSSGSMGSGLSTSGSMGSGVVLHKTMAGSMGSGIITTTPTN
jgi:hypothetical protein